jgi:enediyne biosynthesis protein E4
MKYLHLPILALLLFFSCKKSSPGGAAFTEIPRSRSNIDFRNLLIEKETFNIFKYQYFYNGGGTAVGDFNNDGLIDIVFTGNMVKNRLYLNQGDFEFKDATLASGIAEKEGWCTGATPIDINQDGWLDLYICRAGYPFDNLRSNLLFINQGATADKSVKFVEKAAEYGLADLGHATQASFFDYDKDGDLDLFLINHSTVEYSRGSLDIYSIKGKKNPDFTNKLFRNDPTPQGPHFSNVTEPAGITSNVLTFSLGLNTCDINLDGWPDIFVSNDFNEPDYLFINQKDGTFKEELTARMDHTSLFSMGCDLADFNGDGLPDLISLDMLPEGNHLQKMHSGADNFEKVYTMMRNGFYKQYSRNMLQLNNGDGSFSEIGQLAGVSNTDWSWASLFFDFDNDGARDLFISNGYPRDHTNMDFLKFTADEVVRIQKGEQNIGFQEYLKKMPPIMEPNYFYKNEGGLRFSNQTTAWGLNKPLVTQSAAWADLDNDGDLDLVLNNTNDYANVLENNADKNPQNHWLRLQLQGSKGNPWGIGAKVWAYAAGSVVYVEQNPVRGFQSSVDPVLSLGLGHAGQLDSLVLVWPTDEKQVLKNVASNQTLVLKMEDAQERWVFAPKEPAALFEETPGAIPFQHRENENNDLKKQSLMPWFYSRQGPALAIGDVNGDGLEDVFLGGAKDQVSALFLQAPSGRFVQKPQASFAADAGAEAVDACFFDADGDGDPDLYVCSGGYEFEPGSPLLQDKLYRNDGRGNFSADEQSLPKPAFPGTCVRPADVDGDGDLDLFVGGGVLPGNYPKTAPSALWLNDGKGKFSAYQEFPAATDALWMDENGDKLPDLILAAEWSPIMVFENKKGRLEQDKGRYMPFNTTGLWCALHAADLDGDGDQDLIAGNLGLNTQMKASETEALDMWYDDFDRNGSIDPLMFYYVQGKSYPLASMEDLTGQLPFLRKKFNYFKDYADAQVGDVLLPAQMTAATHAQAANLQTLWLENKNGVFEKRQLPIQAQFAPVQAIAALDANGDGNMDIVLAGNRTHARVKLGSLDGNHGQLFLGDGKGGFVYASQRESAFKVTGDVRALGMLKINGKTGLVFCVNNSMPNVYLCRN